MTGPTVTGPAVTGAAPAGAITARIPATTLLHEEAR